MIRTIATLALIMLTTSNAMTQSSFSETGISAIDEYLRQVVEQTYVPGIVAIVTNERGVIYSGAFGNKDVRRDRAMTTDTIFRIASMTKPITSVAVMMLVEAGHVGLDEPISNYIPDLAGKDVFETFNPQDKSFTSRPANSEITVRHLLTHTSGLGYSFSNEILFQLMGGGPPRASVTSYPLLHDPGTRWTYGENTRVLGSLVEAVSGESLDNFLRERIFDPLGMIDTAYLVPIEKRDRVTTTHTKTTRGLAEAPNPEGPIGGAPRGDGGLLSTAADYSKFMRMFLNEGRGPDGVRLLGAGSIDHMGRNQLGELRVELQPAADASRARPFPQGAGRDGFGLGFQITGSHSNADMRSPGSMSWAGILNTEFWIDPERGIGAVLLMQYLPFYDETALDTLNGFEERVYRHLE